MSENKRLGDLAATIAVQHGISRTEAAAAVSAVFNTIKHELRQGNAVTIKGFGSFRVCTATPRMVASFRQPAKMTTPRPRVCFKGSVVFRDKLR